MKSKDTGGIEMPEALDLLKTAIRHGELARVNGFSSLLFGAAGLGVAALPSQGMTGLTVGISLLVAGGLAAVASAHFSTESSLGFFDAAHRWGALKGYFDVRPAKDDIDKRAESLLESYPFATPETVNWSVWPWKEPFAGD